MSIDLPIAGWKDQVLLILRRRKAFVVDGESMYPVLKSGNKVLVDPKSQIAAGDIVLAQHPYKQGTQIIKRVTEITMSDDYFLVGDNADESTDSRTFGKLRSTDILGKVVCKLS